MQDSPGVVEVITKRIKDKSKPLKRNDPYKVGLIIGGGAWRGTISAGMEMALEHFNALYAFDDVYGVSAGAINAAYFVAEQAYLGTVIYTDDLIKDKNFFDPMRMFKGKSPIQVTYLTHHICKKIHRLKGEKIINSPVRLHIYATSAKNGKIVEFSKFNNEEEVLDVLHWSSRLPVICGLPIKAGDDVYTDGEVLVGGLPLQQALDDGCTHVLILMTKPENESERFSTFERVIFDHLICRVLKLKGYSNLIKNYKEGFENYEIALKKIEESKDNPLALPKIETVEIKDGISRLETNQEILRQAVMRGYNAVLEKFKPYNLEKKEI